MTDSKETLCFTCGQPSGDFPRLNCLPGGQVCPTCRDRLLECLPPCLPGEANSLEEFFEDGAPTTDLEASESEESESTPTEEPQSSDSTPSDHAAVGPHLEASRGPGQLLKSEGLDNEPA